MSWRNSTILVFFLFFLKWGRSRDTRAPSFSPLCGGCGMCRIGRGPERDRNGDEMGGGGKEEGLGLFR